MRTGQRQLRTGKREESSTSELNQDSPSAGTMPGPDMHYLNEAKKNMTGKLQFASD